MKCKVCRIDKLSHEFPADTISQKCTHVSNFCLRVSFNSIYVFIYLLI